MVNITIDNVYTQIDNIPTKEIETIIWDKLSYEIWVFGAPYPNIKHLYNRRTKKTYTGLLPYILKILEDYECEYKINDTRIIHSPNADYELITEINNKPFALRPYQQRIINECQEREIIQAATGAGKALPIDTLILTPNGFVPMRDIHIGDIVYDENGNKTTVIGEYPQGELQEYEITFNDGTSVKCCKDHLWKFATRDNLAKGKWQIKTTEEMLNNFNLRSSKRYNLSIPNCKPIQFDKKELFLPPYLLGALLGDGGFSQNQITFTNTEEDVINKVQKLSSQFGGIFKKFKSHNIQYTYVCGRYKENSLKDYLHNTFGKITSEKKFIPNEYKYSTIKDRIALLQGLFDTDGCVSEKGHIRYTSVSKQLVEDIMFVLNSLGYRTKIVHRQRKDKNATWDINVRACDDKLFTSIKHKTRFNNRQVSNKQHHYDVMKIVSIKALPTTSEMKCIAVDSPEHTYICKDFIVTHNTLMMAGVIAKFNVKPVAIFANTNSLCQQLRAEISKFLNRPIGLVCMGVREIEDITVYSIQSTTENDVVNTKMILFDECHHIAADTFVNVAKWCKNAYYRIGVSATPWRDDGADLMIESSLNKRDTNNNINASYLIKEGYLVPCNIYMLTVKGIYKGKTYDALYKNAIVNNNQRNYYGCKCALKMLKNNNATTLILIKYIEHGEIILKMLQKALCKLGYMQNTGTDKDPIYMGKMVTITNPINGRQQSVMVRFIEFLSGKDDAVRRTAVIEGVKQGIVKILIGSTIADEGLDIPNLDCLILLGGGKSSTKAFQRIGRVLRLFKNKEKATIFDFDDETPMLHKHALQRMKMYKTETEWNIKLFNMNLLK